MELHKVKVPPGTILYDREEKRFVKAGGYAHVPLQEHEEPVEPTAAVSGIVAATHGERLIKEGEQAKPKVKHAPKPRERSSKSKGEQAKPKDATAK